MAVGIMAGAEFYKNSINLFNNFDFSKMDEYERYKMNDETANIIQKTLSEYLVPKDDIFESWKVCMGGEEYAESIKSFQRLFTDCEVIPYIYRIPNINTYGDNDAFHSRIHMPCGFVDNILFNNPGKMIYDTDNAKAQHIYTASRTTENNVIGDDFVGYAYNTNFSNYSTPTADNYLYKMNVSKSGKVVAKPLFLRSDDIEPDPQLLTGMKYAVLRKLSNVYGINISIADPTQNLSGFAKKYPGYFKLSSLDFYDNTNDGHYSASNQRQLTGTYTNHSNVSTSGKSTLIFFVKINKPFYQNDVKVLSEYSYACFNFLSLFFGRGIGDKNEDFYKNNSKTMIDTSFRSFGGWEPGLAVPAVSTLFFPPFPYFMSKLSSYFKDSIVISTINSDSETTAPGNAEKNGSILFAKSKDQFIRFFRDNGIPASIIDEELTSQNTDTWQEVEEPQPGSGGYIPEIGGGSYDETPDDAITGAEDNTSQTFLNSSYVMDKTDVRALQQALVNTDFSAFLKTVFQNNPTEGIINLISFPINLGALTTAQKTDVVVIGCNLTEKSPDIPVHGKKVDSLKTRFYLGEFYVNEKYHGFADYDSTRISIYLPFVGYQSLDTSIVMGRHLKIYFNIDYSDGGILYIIYCSNDRGENPNGYFPLITYQGQCGTAIPLSTAQSQQANMNKIIAGVNLAKGAITSIASMNPAPIIAAGAGAAISAATNKPSYSTPSAPAQGAHAYAISNPNQCFLIISYPRSNVPEGFGKFNGYATQLSAKLSELTGFTLCDNTARIDLPCTEEERNMLKAILTSGIVIQ